jgi:hypothetical protein
VKIDIATTEVAPGGCGAILLSVLLHLSILGACLLTSMFSNSCKTIVPLL